MRPRRRGRPPSLELLEASFGDLADFTKLSFSGSVPVTGKVGDQADRLIGELAGKGAIPKARTTRARRIVGKAA